MRDSNVVVTRSVHPAISDIFFNSQHTSVSPFDDGLLLESEATDLLDSLDALDVPNLPSAVELVADYRERL